MKYTIGSRGSLLALTQSEQLKAILEKNTGREFGLTKIKTEGDLNTAAPLWQMDGKDFFTKELDQALLAGSIDLVIHSYKDLGSERPEGIALGAVTKRTFAHDVFLIRKDIISKLKCREIKELIIGTSSPRRIVNVRNNIRKYLPFGENLSVGTKVLRGNVNTRIQKMLDGDYDAIVLALPGLERLAMTDSSREILAGLLKDVTYMVLPQSQFTSAASQGALGVEIRNNELNSELGKIVARLQNNVTVEEVSRERKSFQSYGGGCHLAVGINVKKHRAGFVVNELGEVDDKPVRKRFLETSEPRLGCPGTAFIANRENDTLIKKKRLKNISSFDCDHLMITSYHCLPALDVCKWKHLWTSGTKTWQKLAALGHFVHACADSLGEEEVLELRNSEALKLMSPEGHSKVLSHDLASSILGDVVGCYSREVLTPDNELEEKIESAKVFFWMSWFQYQTYVEHFPFIKDRFHCCGLGKTYNKFSDNKISVLPFLDIEEFENWAGTK